MGHATSKDILSHLYLHSPLFQAYVLVLFFLQGKLSFKESLGPILEGGFRNPENRSKFRHLFYEYIKKKYGQFKLYEKPFSPGSENYVEAIEWVKQVIKDNQYRTDLIKDGDIVIDAGANIGVFSVKVAHTFPGAKIYAFEPTSTTFNALTANTVHYQNITRFNMGLGDETGEKELSIWDNFSGSNSIGYLSSSFGKPDRMEKIKITTIDKIAKHIPRVDFIKMDTEGYESRILKGAAETIKRFKPTIVMSAYHHPEDREELPKLLKSICSEYIFELRHDKEEDLVCWVPKKL